MREIITENHLKLLYRAKVAEEAKMFTDMKDAMKQLAFSKQSLNEKERQLLSVSFKSYLAPIRKTYLVAYTDSQSHVNAEIRKLADNYLQELHEEILQFCLEVIQIVKILKRSAAHDLQAKVYYMKMEADYTRYLSEVEPLHSKTAERAYMNAYSLIDSLPKTDPIRLGVALNYAIFTYCSLKNTKEALDILNDKIPEEQPSIEDHEAYYTYALMKDNQRIWKAEIKENSTIAV